MISMADRDGLIWFDGEMVDWREAKIHVLTHTLHYGMGETVTRSCVGNLKHAAYI